jgi:hypothetical protein
MINQVISLDPMLTNLTSLLNCRRHHVNFGMIHLDCTVLANWLMTSMRIVVDIGGSLGIFGLELVPEFVVGFEDEVGIRERR